MTKREKVIVTAYTGILMADLEDVYAYAKECEKRNIMTHDFADSDLWERLKKYSREEFLEICSK